MDDPYKGTPLEVEETIAETDQWGTWTCHRQRNGICRRVLEAPSPAWMDREAALNQANRDLPENRRRRHLKESVVTRLRAAGWTDDEIRVVHPSLSEVLPEEPAMEPAP
ncbi:MAG: hypothetical protein HY600_05310 [Candidatus Omnitrophica bacterium]|nr:hypothetical protein [Candidatus Omnitrophota bacterium]